MKHLTSLLVLSLLLASIDIVKCQGLNELQKAGIKIIERICVGQTGVDINLVKGFRKGNHVDDPVLKQYLLCFFKFVGAIDDQGNLQEDTIREELKSRIGEEKAKKAVEECISQKDNALETAFAYAKCTWKYRPEGYEDLK